jgi:hypothetical protein
MEPELKDKKNQITPRYDATFHFPWGAGGSQLDYVLKGGDFIGEFAGESVSTGQKPFVAIRLNDGQMCSHPPIPDNATSGVNNDHQFDRLSRFWCVCKPLFRHSSHYFFISKVGFRYF